MFPSTPVGISSCPAAGLVHPPPLGGTGGAIPSACGALLFYNLFSLCSSMLCEAVAGAVVYPTPLALFLGTVFAEGARY